VTIFPLREAATFLSFFSFRVHSTHHLNLFFHAQPFFFFLQFQSSLLLFIYLFLDPSKKTLFILYYSSYNKFLGFYIWSTNFVHGYHNGVSDPLRESRECHFV
jgi:hypothetical protein